MNGQTDSAANNADYSEKGNTFYGTTGSYPGYLAYNLSSVAAVQQGQLRRVYATWINGVADSGWDYQTGHGADAGIPSGYTIDVACQNLATTTLPISGWVSEGTVTGNTLHTRSHLVSMVDPDPGNQCHGNYNWIRIDSTVGGNFWKAWQFKWDIWDATHSAADTWMFYGDSITAGAAPVKDTDYDVTFAKQINAWNSKYYPAVEGGGMSGWTAAGFLTDATTVDGSGDSSPWLPKTLAHFVVLGLGTNDCNSSYASVYQSYQTSLSQLVDAVMTDPADRSDPNTAGRVVIIPTLPASPALRSGTNTVQMLNSATSSYQPTTVTGNGGGPACNEVIARVIAAKQAQYGKSRVLAGPDLWTILSNPSVQWYDGLHPASDAQGDGIWRSAWVHWAETHVYGSLIK